MLNDHTFPCTRTCVSSSRSDCFDDNFGYYADENEGLEWCYELNDEYNFNVDSFNRSVCVEDIRDTKNDSFRGVIPECNNGVCYMFNGTYEDGVRPAVAL